VGREGLVLRVPDARPGERGESEHTAASWVDTRKWCTADEHGGEAHPVTGTPSDLRGVTAARLVEGDGLRVLAQDLVDRLVDDGGIGGPRITGRLPGQAQIHLQHRVPALCVPRGRGQRHGRHREEGRECGNGQGEKGRK